MLSSWRRRLADRAPNSCPIYVGRRLVGISKSGSKEFQLGSIWEARGRPCRAAPRFRGLAREPGGRRRAGLEPLIPMPRIVAAGVGFTASAAERRRRGGPRRGQPLVSHPGARVRGRRRSSRLTARDLRHDEAQADRPGSRSDPLAPGDRSSSAAASMMPPSRMRLRKEAANWTGRRRYG